VGTKVRREERGVHGGSGEGGGVSGNRKWTRDGWGTGG